MPLRPSHCESMSHSRCTPNSASTHAVSRLVPEPLPHASSVPVKVTPFWPPQRMPGRVVSSIENEPPEPDVLMVTLP